VADESTAVAKGYLLRERLMGFTASGERPSLVLLLPSILRTVNSCEAMDQEQETSVQLHDILKENCNCNC
jgi:hypothetical protein